MSQELVNPSNLPLTQMTEAQLLGRLSKGAQALSGNFKLFLQFDGRVGTYKYKDDDRDVPVALGTEVAVNLLAAIQGYTCWKGGQVVDTTPPLSFFMDDPYHNKDANELLPFHGPYAKGGQNQMPEGWVKYVQFEVKFLDSGKEFLFKTSSKSGLKGFGQFWSKVADAVANGQYKVKEDVPIVTLGSAAFFNKANQKAYKPKLDIVRWEVGALLASTPDEAKEAFATAQANSDPLSAMKAAKGKK